MTAEKMLSVKEVAEHIGVTEWAVRRWVHAGKIHGAKRFGRIIRIPESFLSEGTEEDGTTPLDEGPPPGLDYDPRDEWS